MSENENFCCICGLPTEEDAPILAYGAYGHPRLLCHECEEQLDTASRDRDPDLAREAIGRLAEKMTKYDPDDLTVAKMNIILKKSTERADLIESEEYDFSDDEAEEEEEFTEIPEELRETEEDRALDEMDEERNQKFDRIFGIVSAIIFGAILAFIVYKLISGFFL